MAERTAKLAENEARLREVIAKTPHPMCIVNSRTQDIEYYNEAFVATFGYTLDDVPTAEEWWKAAYPDADYREIVRSNWGAAVAEAAATGRGIAPQEWRMRRKDGLV